MDYGIFNVRTDINARDCTRGCTDTVRESAVKFDSGRKIPCRTGELNLRERHDGPMLLPTELEKSETKLTASFLKKKIQTHKRSNGQR